MSESPWYERPLDRRAPAGGEEGCDGVTRKGGEFEPFYVPRPLMPQVGDLRAFRRFAKARNVGVDKVTLPASLVEPHQRVIWDPERAPSAEGAGKRILISRDRFILDGHHRWFAAQRAGEPVRALWVDLDWEPAIAFLFEFPGTTSGEA